MSGGDSAPEVAAAHGLRRSVLLRLLAVSLVVATCSIAAAAWITTRSTSEQIRDDQRRSLETDNRIYDDLIEYGRAHNSWEGAGSLVSKLAADTGRTITIRSPAGEVHAAAGLDGDNAPIDDDTVPTAQLDPLAPMVIRAEEYPSSPAMAREVKLGSDLPAAVLYLAPDEVTERRTRADEGAACARRFGVSAQIVTANNGAAQVQFAGDEVVDERVYTVCYDPTLDAPGALELAVRNDVAAATAACLGERGYAPVVQQQEGDIVGPDYVELDDNSTAAANARAECEASATETVVTPYVAPVALLFLTSGGEATPSWFESAGGTRIVFVLLAVLVVTIVLTALGASRILRPIRALTNAAQRMASGDLAARVRIRGGDEVARLGSAFNAMADAVERNEQQRKALVSDVAHELRNPLANVRGYLEGAQDDVVRLDGALVDSLLEETLVLQHLIDDLQDLALADAGRLRVHPEPTEGRALAEQVVASHRQQAERAGVTLRAEGHRDASVEADPVRLRQALGNLVANALRYTPVGGTVTVRVHGDAAATGPVEFEVVDTGSGIAAEHLPHLFDRFYRADASRSRDTGGSGLGLAITRHLVEAHGGTIGVASKVGTGTRFTIRIPRAAPRVRTPRRATTTPVASERVPRAATDGAAPVAAPAPVPVPSVR
jgi:two-component system sensor histidine kinase BaeS